MNFTLAKRPVRFLQKDIPIEDGQRTLVFDSKSHTMGPP